jgi:septal ring-binding cell division protein DamX
VNTATRESEADARPSPGETAENASSPSSEHPEATRTEEKAGGRAPTPAGSEPGEDILRRFADGIHVRLDILEDALGGLQDEVARLQQVASDSAEAAQRRLWRVFAAGQLLLAVLLLVLFLLAWPMAGQDPSPRSPVVDRSEPPGAPSEMRLPTETANPQPAPVGETLSPPIETGREEPPQDAEPEGPAQGSEPAGPSASNAVPEDEEPAGAAASARSTEPPDHTTPGAGTPDSPEGSRPRPGAEEATGGAGDEASPTAPIPGSADNGVGLEGERFAVQLIAFRSESNVATFMDRFGVRADARYLHARIQAQNWYFVFLGIYETREEAGAAIDALPAPLRELGPWIRPLPAGSRLLSFAEGADPDAPE